MNFVLLGVKYFNPDLVTHLVPIKMDDNSFMTEIRLVGDDKSNTLGVPFPIADVVRALESGHGLSLPK